jgi:calcineurin-like phosphoesterase family protein
MKTWITSDLHFGHKNIMKFCPKTRGHYTDTDVMREDMIRIWNDNVQDGDLVYILGDVAFLPAVEAVAIMRRLNGRKILVEGNHDRKILNDPVFRSCFEEIHKYLEIRYNDTMIVMLHYPIAEWNQMHRGAVHFYGHLHGNPSGLENYRARDVAYDATGHVVWLMEDAIADALKGEIKGHHV